MATGNALHDDIRVLQAEIVPEGDGTRHFLYRLDLDGAKIWKAVRLLRVTRVPRPVEENRRLMDVHRDVLAAMWQSQVNFLHLMANILVPEPHGLVLGYGVQAVADTPHEAMRRTDMDYAALEAALAGTFAQVEFRPLKLPEAHWLLDRLGRFRSILRVLGIPQPRRDASGQTPRLDPFGYGATAESEEQAEEFIRAMAGREFVWLTVTSPVDRSDLTSWLEVVSDDLTRWKSVMQGSRAISAGVSLPLTLGGQSGTTDGWQRGTSETDSTSHTVGHSVGVTQGESVQQSDSVGFGRSVGQSEQVSRTDSVSHGVSESQGVTVSHQEGISRSQQIGLTESETAGRSIGVSESQGQSRSVTVTDGVSTGQSRGVSVSDATSASQQVSQQVTQGWGVSQGVSQGGGTSQQHSASTGATEGRTTQVNANVAIVGGNTGWQSSTAQILSDSTGVQTNWSASSGSQASQAVSSGQGQSLGTTHQVQNSFTESVQNSHSVSTGKTVSRQTGVSVTDSYGVGVSRSMGIGEARSVQDGVSVSRQQSVSDTRGVALGHSLGTQVSDSVSQQTGTAHTASQARSVADSVSDTQGKALARAAAVSGALQQGTGAALGFGPFLSVSKSYQWVDANVENLVRILDAQRERLMKSLQGQGAMFTDVYVFLPDEDAASAATAAAKGAFYGDVLPAPVEVVPLDPARAAHHSEHAHAFSVCTEPDPAGGVDSYRWTTILLPTELAALTHPVRSELGGVATHIENIPRFHVPSSRQGEMDLGAIVSPDRWLPSSGFVTPFRFRLRREELAAVLVAGAARSGKTEGALRLVSEAWHKVTFGTGPDGRPRRMGVLALDWKKDWRRLARFIPPEDFRYWNLAREDLFPVRANVLAVPPGIPVQHWVNLITECFCLGFDMGGRAKSLVWQHLMELYEMTGVFADPARSKAVGMDDLFDLVLKAKNDFDNPQSGKGRVGNDVRDAYQRTLDRLIYFKTGDLKARFCVKTPDALCVTDLAEVGRVTVLEAAGLDKEQKNFLLGLVAAGVFYRAKAVDAYDPGLLLIFEEAHQVLKGTDQASGGDGTVLNIGETIYEEMFNEGAGLGIFLVAVAQAPDKLPTAVITNSSAVMAYRLDTKPAIEVVVRKIGKEERYDDRPIAKWFPRQPIGWCVVRSARVYDFKEAEPSLIQTTRMEGAAVTDDDLRAHFGHGQFARFLH